MSVGQRTEGRKARKKEVAASERLRELRNRPQTLPHGVAWEAHLSRSRTSDDWVTGITQAAKATVCDPLALGELELPNDVGNECDEEEPGRGLFLRNHGRV